jgi:hypothetical protein
MSTTKYNYTPEQIKRIRGVFARIRKEFGPPSVYAGGVSMRSVSWQSIAARDGAMEWCEEAEAKINNQ